MVGEGRKTKQWYYDHVDAARHMMGYESDNGFRISMQEKRLLYDLHYGKVDMNDFRKIADPMGVDPSFPESVENYPFIKKFLNVLIGEEMDMEFDFTCLLENEDAITEKEDERRQYIQETIMAEMAGETDENILNKKMERLNRSGNMEWQDIREKRANALLKYLNRKLNLNYITNRGYEDFLVVGEEIFKCDIWNGEPVVLKLDPLSTFILRSNNSPFIDDCTAIIEDTYETVNRLMDMYGDDLTSKQIKELEDYAGLDVMGNSDISAPAYMINEMIGTDSTGNLVFNIDGTQTSITPDAYNGSGKVRRTTFTWLGLRKMLEVTYYDPKTGDERIKYMPEQYELDVEAGEKSKVVWWNEWHEATKIGGDGMGDGIYVRCRPKPVQFRGMINKNEVKSGFVGITNNTNMNRAESLWSLAKPYQYLYNEFFHRVKVAISKHHGPMLEVDFAQKPDNWTEEQWFWYMKNMNIIAKDSFKVGDKGAATGVIAGNLGHSNFGVKNLDMGGYIRDNIDMLTFIENQVADLLGVPPQRLGSVKERESVRNVQVVKQQSMAVTKSLFYKHEIVKLRLQQTLLETAKYAYKKNPKKAQYILDDNSIALINTDDGFLDEDYGVIATVTSNTANTELREAMKQIQLAAFQNGQGSMALLVDTYINSSMQDIKRKYEDLERERKESESQKQEQLMQMEQEKNKTMMAIEEKKGQMELQKAQISADATVESARISAQSRIEGADKGELSEKDMADLILKRDELDEKIRNNEVKERQNDDKIKVQAKAKAKTGGKK